jgi:hypothetical protein
MTDIEQPMIRIRLYREVGRCVELANHTKKEKEKKKNNRKKRKKEKEKTHV